MYRSIVIMHPFVTIVCTYIYIECSTVSTEPVSFNTMYVFNRLYHLVQCSLAMCRGWIMPMCTGSTISTNVILVTTPSTQGCIMILMMNTWCVLPFMGYPHFSLTGTIGWHPRIVISLGSTHSWPSRRVRGVTASMIATIGYH